MNNMRKLNIIWGILVFLIFGALTIYGIAWKKENKVYKDAENKIRDLAKTYKDAALVPEGAKIDVSELIEADLMSDLKVNNEKCSGYVEIKKENNFYKYKGYIKCPSYTTKGY